MKRLHAQGLIRAIVTAALMAGLVALLLYLGAGFIESHRFVDCGPSGLSTREPSCRTAPLVFAAGRAALVFSISLLWLASSLRLRRHRVLRAVFVTVTAILLAGYITARLSQRSIERETRRYVMTKGISGVGFGGARVPPEKITVESRVRYPFVVEGRFSVPFDLHASVYMTTYLTMPWGRYVLSTKREFLL